MLQKTLNVLLKSEWKDWGALQLQPNCHLHDGWDLTITQTHDGTDSFNHPAEPMRLATPPQRRRFLQHCCGNNSRSRLSYSWPRPSVPVRRRCSPLPMGQFENPETKGLFQCCQSSHNASLRPAPLACHAHSFSHSHKHHLRTPLSPKLHSSPLLSSQLEMGVATCWPPVWHQ